MKEKACKCCGEMFPEKELVNGVSADCLVDKHICDVCGNFIDGDKCLNCENIRE